MKQAKKTLKQKQSSCSLVCAKQNREIPHGQTKTAMQTQHRNVITKMLFIMETKPKPRKKEHTERKNIKNERNDLFVRSRRIKDTQKKVVVCTMHGVPVLSKEVFLKWFCVRQRRDLLIFDGKASGHRIFIRVYKV